MKTSNHRHSLKFLLCTILSCKLIYRCVRCHVIVHCAVCFQVPDLVRKKPNLIMAILCLGYPTQTQLDKVLKWTIIWTVTAYKVSKSLP